MEQHKLREKLQNRSYVPSGNSWEQLREKLDANEGVQPRKRWLFLKYASVILVLMAVSLYFFKPTKQTSNTPIIAAPTLKEDLKTTPLIKVETQVRVAEISEDNNNNNTKEDYKKKAIINTSKKEFIAVNNKKNQLLISENENRNPESIEVVNEEILIVEEPSEEELLNAEVDQLLKNSTIKLRVNRQISRKRAVSAQTLLTEVEDDLDKDFKEKLVETIVTTLKKPRKVVITDRGN